jgi:Flp pilus assembly protein TadB
VSARRRRSSARSRGAWPLWVRLVVFAVVVGAAVWVALWFHGLATWAKVLVVGGAVLLVVLWWFWTRRREIAAEMDRRAREQRRRPR